MDSALLERIRLTPSRGDYHVFLGHPLSATVDKTTVEPGNSFSPGLWTFGVTVWVTSGDSIVSAVCLDADQIGWDLDGPVLSSRFESEGIVVQTRLTHLSGRGACGVDYLAVDAEADVALSIHIAVTPKGPAGSRNVSFRWIDGKLISNSGTLLVCDQEVDDAFVQSDLVVLSFDVSQVSLRVEHHFDLAPLAFELPKTHRVMTTADAFEQSREDWRYDLPARVACSNPNVGRLWEQSAYHLLAAMEAGQPRIGVANYPASWIRDGVIVLRATDLLGRHDLARIGCDSFAGLLFAGGFGAEADSPGEVIWAISHHAMVTGDRSWLMLVWPDIVRRVEWLDRMTSTTEPIYVVGENRTLRDSLYPSGGVVCFENRNGLVHARMDWHTPDFYINCWVAAGYRCASWCSDFLGLSDGEKWSERAKEIDRLIEEHLLPDYGNDRDPAVAPWPSGYFVDGITPHFRRWYTQNRLDETGHRSPEPEWTYFEAAQIHNAVLLGLWNEARVSFDGMVNEGIYQVGAFAEGGRNEYLPYGHPPQMNGWLREDHPNGGNMPHNWTSAEMIALIRDLFIQENDNGLVIAPVARYWWPDCSAKDLPTRFGPVSFRIVDGELVDYVGPDVLIV